MKRQSITEKAIAVLRYADKQQLTGDDRERAYRDAVEFVEFATTERLCRRINARLPDFVPFVYLDSTRKMIRRARRAKRTP